MGDKRVYPATVDTDPPLPPSLSAPPSPFFSCEHPQPPNHPPPSKPVPPPATYVVQFPREQILRYPPQENARKFQSLTRRRNRRSCCRRCCCFALCLLLLLVVAAVALAGSLYLVVRFRSPRYTVTSLALRGMNTSAVSISPGFDATIGAENPNGRVGIYYLTGSAVNVLFDGVRLGGGTLPVFYQPRRNATVLRTAVTGSAIMLGGEVRTALRDANNRRRIPLVVRISSPVKFKVGSVRTWEITVKVKCDVVLDALNERARIVYRDCDYSVRLW